MAELQPQSVQLVQQQQMLSKCLLALRQAHKESRWDVLPGIDDRVNQCLNWLKAHAVNDQYPASIQPLMDKLIAEYRSVIDDCNREREQLKQKLGNIRHAQHAMAAYKDGMLAGGRPLMAGMNNLSPLSRSLPANGTGTNSRIQSQLNNTVPGNAADFNAAMGTAKDTARQQFDSVFPETGGNPLSQLDPEALEQLKAQFEDYLQRASEEDSNPAVPSESELSEGEKAAGMIIASLISLWTQESQPQQSGGQSGNSDSNDAPTIFPAGVIKSVNARVALEEAVLSVPSLAPAIDAALVGAREGMSINAAMQATEQRPPQTLSLAGTPLPGTMSGTMPGDVTADDLLQALGTDAEELSLDERRSAREPGESRNALPALDSREQKDEAFARMLAGASTSRPATTDYLNLQLTRMAAADASTPSHAVSSGAAQAMSSTSPTQLNSALSPAQQLQQPVIPTPQSLALNGDMARWSEAMGERLVMMASKGQQEAKIRLDPPELGRLGINLSLNGDELSVRFHTTVMPVRDIIESRFDQLRASLSDQGLNLVNVDVETGQQGADSRQYQDEYFAGGDTNGSGGYGAGEAAGMDDDSGQEATLSGHMSPSLNPVHMLDAFV